MRIRIRSPEGTSTLTLSDDASIHDLTSSISKQTSLDTFDIKHGYPPKPLDLSPFTPSTRLRDTDLKLNGEQLIILARRNQERNDDSTAAQEQKPTAPNPSTTTAKTSLPTHPWKGSGVGTTAPAPAPPQSELDTPEIPIPSHGGTVVLRVMPDDNSCMFRALGAAVLGPGLDSVTELRSVVAQSIQAQPELYSAAVLQMAPDAYCGWIQRPDAWGGGIELGILSQVFDVEVCSINVQDLRVDRFNEGARRRCVLVYSGIHYDTIAVSTSSAFSMTAGLEAENDVKVFDAADAEILDKAKELCRVLQRKHYYTDTSGFAVSCLDCGWKGRGEKGATKHAAETGHYNFDEGS